MDYRFLDKIKLIKKSVFIYFEVLDSVVQNFRLKPILLEKYQL